MISGIAVTARIAALALWATIGVGCTRLGYTPDASTDARPTPLDSICRCGPNATCESDGQCVCKAGYQGQGTWCFEVNECLTNHGGCSANATCSNIPGSYTCACNAGYTGDGITCCLVCGEAALVLGYPSCSAGGNNPETATVFYNGCGLDITCGICPATGAFCATPTCTRWSCGRGNPPPDGCAAGWVAQGTDCWHCATGDPCTYDDECTY